MERGTPYLHQRRQRSALLSPSFFIVGNKSSLFDPLQLEFPQGLVCETSSPKRRSTVQKHYLAMALRLRPSSAMSGCPKVSVLEAGHCIRLFPFWPLDNVELDFVTFFERFEPPRLNR